MVSVSAAFGKPAASELQRRPCVIATFEHVPPASPSAIAAAIAAVEPLPEAPVVQISQDPASGNLLGLVEMGEHRVELVGLNQPAPEAIVTRVIEASHWTDEHKDLARDHGGHIVLDYAGSCTNGLERYLALYKICHALGGKDLRAVLNEAAWTFSPGGLVAELLKAPMLEEVRHQVPPNVWTGFVGLRYNDGIWYATKGHEHFDAPDLVHFVPDSSDEDPADVLDMFMNLFLYCIERRVVLAPGHSLELQRRGLLHFEDAPTDVPGLRGNGETLAIVASK